MPKQTFLFAPAKPDSPRKNCRIASWNLQNPSFERAIQQSKWLEARNFDAIALTEAKDSKGCHYIQDRLESRGYKTFFPKIEGNEYGVILAAKEMKNVEAISPAFLPNRCASAYVDFGNKSILLSGVYAPSGETRNEPEGKKRKFQNAFLEMLSNPENQQKFPEWIVMGDLNILEPEHFPKYSVFTPWEYEFYQTFAQNQFVDAFRHFHPKENEYSWFGKQNDGYRFDHAFISKSILPLLKAGAYDHEPRLQKLSDHSAICLELDNSQ